MILELKMPPWVNGSTVLVVLARVSIGTEVAVELKFCRNSSPSTELATEELKWALSVFMVNLTIPPRLKKLLRLVIPLQHSWYYDSPQTAPEWVHGNYRIHARQLKTPQIDATTISTLSASTMAQLSFLSVILLSAIRDLSLQHFHGVFLCGRLPPTFKNGGCAMHRLLSECTWKKNFPALQVVDYNEKKLEEGRCDSECGARTNQEPLEKKCVRLSYTFRQGEENPAELRSHHRTSNWIRGVQPACCTYMTGIFKLQCEARSTIVPNTRIRASKNYANPTTTTLKARRMAHEAAIPREPDSMKLGYETYRSSWRLNHPRCTIYVTDQIARKPAFKSKKNCQYKTSEGRRDKLRIPHQRLSNLLRVRDASSTAASIPAGIARPRGYSATRASAVPPMLRVCALHFPALSPSIFHVFGLAVTKNFGASKDAKTPTPRLPSMRSRVQSTKREETGARRPASLGPPRHWAEQGGRGTAHSSADMTPRAHIRLFSPPAALRDDEPRRAHELDEESIARSRPVHVPTPRTNGNEVERSHLVDLEYERERGGGEERAGTKGNAGEKEDVEVECPPRRWAGWATGRIDGKKDVPQRGCEERARCVDPNGGGPGRRRRCHDSRQVVPYEDGVMRVHVGEEYLKDARVHGSAEECGREDGEGMGKQRGEDDGAETDETAGGLATGSLKTDQEGESALILHCSTPTRVRGEDDGGGDREREMSLVGERIPSADRRATEGGGLPRCLLQDDDNRRRAA
ncbi:hypothetical protein B0H13DRAFT_1857357 [Mycena leptocephala]|nr:hypothetical protein B0H13DRAFT_1857357 [Mycena leptocephala]